MDQRTVTADTTFFLTNRRGKRYGGNIINEGAAGNLLVQVLSTGGYFSLFKTLAPNASLTFNDYPLSAVTVRLPAGATSGVISIVAWAAHTSQGGVYFVPPGATGFFSLLASVSLTANAATLTTSTFTPLKNLLIIVQIAGFAVADTPGLRFNGDAGANYALIGETNNVTESQSAATNLFGNRFVANDTNQWFTQTRVMNRAAGSVKLALTLAMSAGAGGGGTTPANQSTFMSKWGNTIALVNQVGILGFSGNNLLAGTTIEVWGAA